MSDRGSYRATYSVMIDSPEFRQLSSDGRLVLHTIKNSRLNNMAGIFICGQGGMLTISEQAGLPIGRVSRAIRNLTDTHWVYQSDGLLWVRNQLRFDPYITLANEKHRAGVEKVISGLPKSDILAKYCEYYKLVYPFEGVSNGYRMPMPYRDTDPDTDTDTDTDKSISSGKPDLTSKKVDKIPYQEIIDDLNIQTGKNYRNCDGNKRLIKIVWNQDYSIHAFKYVHRIKTLKWKNDPKMCDYLRPSTLYRLSNFESYLNEDLNDGDHAKKLKYFDRQDIEEQKKKARTPRSKTTEKG